MVSLRAVRENYCFLRQKLTTAECAAVLKANAYGLGVEEVAFALRDCVKTFFVAHYEEGKQLRKILPEHRIFILHGCMPDQFDGVVYHQLTPVLNSLAQVQAWRCYCKEKAGNFHAALQVDSGMSRFGLSESDLQHDDIVGFRPVLVMSHLACADQPESPANDQQRQTFIRLAERFPGAPRSLAASSGIFLGEEYHFDMVRPGAALYGIAPNALTTNVLKPVIHLDARILQIRQIEAGARVGYGLTWHAQNDGYIATVGIGYADGFTRFLSGRASLWWQHYRLPVIGRVSMDSVSVDISDIPAGVLKEGMWLSVIGPQQDVDYLARDAGTIGYEVLTSLGDRFTRIYHDDEPKTVC